MKKRNYKTLKGLLSQTLYGQINFNDFHNGRFYHKKNGFTFFTLADDAKEQCYELMASAIWERNSASRVGLMKNYTGYPHGVLKGISVKLGKNGFRASYCAGQEYTSEIRCVQRIFHNGN